MTVDRRPQHRRLALQLTAVALGAFGFGFALVPLYDVLCAITGYGDKQGLVKASEVTERPDETRTVTVDFMAMVPSVGSWEFRPEMRSMTVTPGKLYSTTFFARNLTGRDTLGQAVPTSRPPRPPCTSARPNASASRRSISPSGSPATCPCASSSTRRCRATSRTSRSRTRSTIRPH